jgi:tetratricopeptide (TPR) repeat protein
VVYTQANEHAKAIALFEQAARKVPAHAAYRFNLGTSYTFLGDLEQAEREYEACLALEPGHGKAHLALAQLRKPPPMPTMSRDCRACWSMRAMRRRGCTSTSRWPRNRKTSATMPARSRISLRERRPAAKAADTEPSAMSPCSPRSSKPRPPGQ